LFRFRLSHRHKNGRILHSFCSLRAKDDNDDNDNNDNNDDSEEEFDASHAIGERIALNQSLPTNSRRNIAATALTGSSAACIRTIIAIEINPNNNGCHAESGSTTE